MIICQSLDREIEIPELVMFALEGRWFGSFAIDGQIAFKTYIYRIVRVVDH